MIVCRLAVDHTKCALLIERKNVLLQLSSKAGTFCPRLPVSSPGNRTDCIDSHGKDTCRCLDDAFVAFQEQSIARRSLKSSGPFPYTVILSRFVNLAKDI